MDSSDTSRNNNSNEVEEEEQNQVQGQGQGVKSESYFLELALLFLFTGNNLVQTLLQNQMIKQKCFELGYNDSICDTINENNNSTKDIEEQIQPYIANLNLVINLLHTIIPAILSLFFGNWSDKHGRKKVLISTFLGYTLTLASFTVVCFYSENINPLPPWFYVICYIPAIFFGGWPSLLSAGLCYITDTCEPSIRSRRLTIVELIIFLGVLIGTFSCSTILQYTDSPTVFIISTSLAAFGFFLVITTIDESVNSAAHDSAVDEVKDLFSPMIIVNLLKTCFKQRLFKGRRILLLLMLIMALIVFTFNGNTTVSYLFVREKFSWTLKDNNLFESYSILSYLIGSTIGFIVFKKFLKLNDMSLACIALTCAITDSFLKAFASETWQMYAITTLTIFKILTSPMCRTVISTIVPQDEIGKVFSITTSFEALSTLLAAPLYAYLYNSTYTTFAGAFYLITASVNVVNLIIAFYVIYLNRIRQSLINPYEQIRED